MIIVKQLITLKHSNDEWITPQAQAEIRGLTFFAISLILIAYSGIYLQITMARPRSEDKKRMILQAATSLFAQEGLTAPTARIAKAAGVAEGTVFTYFTNKDELLNELYLDLKLQLHSALLPSAKQMTLREKVYSAWHTYVHWGVSNPDEHQVLALLAASPKLSAATRNAGDQAFCDVSALLEQALQQTGTGHLSVAFVGALMGAMGNVTMNFMNADPAAAEQTCRKGFHAFWNAISMA